VSAERTTIEFLLDVPHDHAETLVVDRFAVAVLTFSVAWLLTDDTLWHSELLYWVEKRLDCFSIICAGAAHCSSSFATLLTLGFTG